MGNLGKREKILLGVLSIVLLFYAYYSLFLNPAVIKMKELSESIDKARIEANKIRNAKVIIKNQKDQIEELKDSLNMAFKAIPEAEKNPEIAYSMKKLADENRIYFSTITFAGIQDYSSTKDDGKEAENSQNANEQNQGNTTTESNSKTTSSEKLYIVPAAITTEGDYNTTMNYIASIENDSRIAVVKSINMRLDPKSGKIKSNTDIYLFYSDKVSDKEIDYEFNQGIYGKGDLFK